MDYLYTMSITIPIKYNKIYCNLYIVVGGLSTLIFISGIIFLNDYSLFIHSILAVFLIIIGFKLRVNNYATVSKNKIVVFGLLNTERKRYELSVDEVFFFKSNRIVFERNGKLIKVKMNNWFINKYDWERVQTLFSLNDFEKITKHLIDS